jgi:hypothetical protein
VPTRTDILHEGLVYGLDEDEIALFFDLGEMLLYPKR